MDFDKYTVIELDFVVHEKHEPICGQIKNQNYGTYNFVIIIKLPS